MEPRIKKSRNPAPKTDPDRLSSLPDSILTHIFSFLDSATVIRTSVLSKRYRLLWTLSTSLDFRLLELGDERSDFAPKKSAVFESYVNRFLQLREHSNLVKFRLSLHKNVKLEFARNCVRYAAEHKVQHLRIRGYFHPKSLVFPELLVNLPSLVSLNLCNATSESIALPKSVNLPNLKVLCLKNFEFREGNYNGGLFRGCPNLETLVLHKCSIVPANKLKVLDVDCLNLKHLEINRWRSPWRCFNEHLIRVNAPKLAFLKFQGHLVRMSFSEVLHCLERACFDVFFPTACSITSLERKEKTSECFLNMLPNLCNVRVISLSLRTIEVVCALRDLRVYAPVVFENLRVINFTVDNKFGEKKTIPVETIRRMLEHVGTDYLIFDGYKVIKRIPTYSNYATNMISFQFVDKVSPESSENKPERNKRLVTIPVHFMQFLFESAPAAEFLSLEIPNFSSDYE